jgi:thiosulfate/3-mercaptopyruvate sulfurtransferase
MRRTFALTVIAAAFAFLLVQPAESKGLITAKDLAELAEDENVRIVSVRSPDDYAKVHITGAVNVYHSDLYQEGDIKGLLKSPEEIAEILGSNGIAETNTIVVYDGGKNTPSGRLYWILEYLGAEDVKLLDGQMKQWRKARKPVTRKTTEIEAATFTPTPDASIMANIDDVKAGTALLVDVRSKEEFDGEKGEAARKGHIPGAINFEYKNVLNDDDTMKTAEELQAVLGEAGITPEKDIILYCETSVRTGIVYVALNGVLGYDKVRVYDGAMYEWAADPENPLE